VNLSIIWIVFHKFAAVLVRLLYSGYGD